MVLPRREQLIQQLLLRLHSQAAFLPLTYTLVNRSALHLICYFITQSAKHCETLL